MDVIVLRWVVRWVVGWEVFGVWALRCGDDDEPLLGVVVVVFAQ